MSIILTQSFYNQSTLKVARELLGCFLVRKFTPSPATSLRERGVIEKGFKVAPLSHDAVVGEGLGEGAFKIIETEAYVGPNDLASHASRGRTARNQVMFGAPGIIYVYFTYGMHYMLNIVTERKDYPAAILIRAVEPNLTPQPPLLIRRGGGAIATGGEVGEGRHKFHGPARLTKSLKINKSFNGLPIYTKKYGLWIESRDTEIKPSQIKKATRVGVDYAKEYKFKLWRFYLKDSEFVSKK